MLHTDLQSTHHRAAKHKGPGSAGAMTLHDWAHFLAETGHMRDVSSACDIPAMPPLPL